MSDWIWLLSASDWITQLGLTLIYAICSDLQYKASNENEYTLCWQLCDIKQMLWSFPFNFILSVWDVFYVVVGHQNQNVHNRIGTKRQFSLCLVSWLSVLPHPLVFRSSSSLLFILCTFIYIWLARFCMRQKMCGIFLSELVWHHLILHMLNPGIFLQIRLFFSLELSMEYNGIYQFFMIHSPVDQQLGWCQFFAMMNEQ